MAGSQGLTSRRTETSLSHDRVHVCVNALLAHRALLQINGRHTVRDPERTLCLDWSGLSRGERARRLREEHARCLVGRAVGAYLIDLSALLSRLRSVHGGPRHVRIAAIHDVARHIASSLAQLTLALTEARLRPNAEHGAVAAALLALRNILAFVG